MVTAVVIAPCPGNGALTVDGETIRNPVDKSIAVSLAAGTHRVEWFDSSARRRYGETIDVLPFEIITVSLTRFNHGI